MENKGSNVRYNKINITFPDMVIVENIIPRNMIINLGCASVDNHILYNITRCYSDGEYCHLFAIAAGDIIKYQGGHMMRNADARTVRSRQETFNSNGGHDAGFGDFKLQITSLLMIRNIKCGYSFS